MHLRSNPHCHVLISASEKESAWLLGEGNKGWLSQQPRGQLDISEIEALQKVTSCITKEIYSPCAECLTTFKRACASRLVYSRRSPFLPMRVSADGTGRLPLRRPLKGLIFVDRSTISARGWCGQRPKPWPASAAKSPAACRPTLPDPVALRPRVKGVGSLVRRGLHRLGAAGHYREE